MARRVSIRNEQIETTVVDYGKENQILGKTNYAALHSGQPTRNILIDFIQSCKFFQITFRVIFRNTGGLCQQIFEGFILLLRVKIGNIVDCNKYQTSDSDKSS